MNLYFHTIKSILNCLVSLLIIMLIMNFHTIKSILNISSKSIPVALLIYFHTIKSILNLGFNRMSSFKVWISILLSLF